MAPRKDLGPRLCAGWLTGWLAGVSRPLSGVLCVHVYGEQGGV